MLANVIKLVSGCVTFLGGFLVVWGAVSLGLAIREQQGGPQIATRHFHHRRRRDHHRRVGLLRAAGHVLAAGIGGRRGWRSGYRSRRTSASTRRRSSGR